MAPNPPDSKRKHGRPPGASKADQDAPGRDNNDETDVEEQTRPKKRGRKDNRDDTVTRPGPAARDGTAQLAKMGRRLRNSPQNGALEPEPAIEQREKRVGRKGTVTVQAANGKGKATQRGEAQAEDQPSSSEPRRSRREQRPWNPDEVFGARRMSPPQHQEVPSSTLRRSGRERREWDPDRVFSGSRNSDEQQAESAPVAEKSKPKNRAIASSQEGASSKARGKRPAVATEKKRRGRPSLDQDGNVNQGASQANPKKQAKAQGKGSKEAQPPATGGSEGASHPSRRGKASREAQPSVTDISRDAAYSKRRGRPRTSDVPVQVSEQNEISESRAASRRRLPKSRDAQQTAPNSKRKPPQPRQPEPDREASSESEDGRELPFRHLRETTRDIPRSTISEKWNALDGPSINAVGSFLADAQRPVLLRLQDTNRRREHASSALSLISRRLRSKLVNGFPFPGPTAGVPTKDGAGSYEDEFNFERTVDAIQNLEKTLNPLLHSVSLLDKEINREEDALARDYDSLHTLEANAKSEAKRWREQARREHVLAPGIRRKGDGDEGDEGPLKDRLELVPGAEDEALGGLFKDLQDEELVALSNQIGSHMESMKGNLQQIGGVVPAIIKSKAALQQVLLKHLDEEQYEKVLVG